jgi:flagellar operon protein
MVNSIYNLPGAIIRNADNIRSKAGNDAQSRDKTQSFKEILENQRISFSRHANQRTEERSIRLGEAELNRLGDACSKAEEKGIRDALIIMNDAAFIVNAKNKVVVTVIDKNEMKDNVFSNIDGALFI